MVRFPGYGVYGMLKSMYLRSRLITVLLAMFSVMGNSVCSVKCITTSSDTASHTRPTEQDRGCHHDGDKNSPVHDDQECSHAPLFIDNSVRTVAGVSSADVTQADLYLSLSRALGTELDSVAGVAPVDFSPPPFVATFSPTVLRV